MHGTSHVSLDLCGIQQSSEGKCLRAQIYTLRDEVDEVVPTTDLCIAHRRVYARCFKAAGTAGTRRDVTSALEGSNNHYIPSCKADTKSCCNNRYAITLLKEANLVILRSATAPNQP